MDSEMHTDFRRGSLVETTDVDTPPPSEPEIALSILKSLFKDPIVRGFMNEYTKLPQHQQLRKQLFSLFNSGYFGDEAFVWQYSSKEEFIRMIRDPAFQKFLLEAPGVAFNTTSAADMLPYSVHQAVWKGDLKSLKEKLEFCADLSKLDNDGRTALSIACVIGQVQCAKILIQAGADVNALDNRKDTALHYAAAAGNKECVELLLKHGALAYRNQYGHDPFEVAKLTGRSEEILKLFGKMLTVNTASDVGAHQAIWTGDLEGLKLALKSGIDINKRDTGGRTALIVACSLGEVKCAKILLEAAGIDVYARDNLGYTAFMHAAANGKICRKNCVALLLENGVRM